MKLSNLQYDLKVTQNPNTLQNCIKIDVSLFLSNESENVETL